jgi:hypothetical protein
MAKEIAKKNEIPDLGEPATNNLISHVASHELYQSDMKKTLAEIY